MRPENSAQKILKNHWQEAVSAQCVGVIAALLLLLLGWYADRALVAAVPPRIVQPCRMLLTLLLCFVDLLIRSPIRAGQAALYRTLANGQDIRAPQVFSAYRAAAYKKAVTLRAALWGRRVALYAAACLPPAFLLACGDRMQDKGLVTSAEQIAYLLLSAAAGICLLVGLVSVELLLLRYMPAWYLLTECNSTREAMRLSRRMMHGQVGAAVWLYLRYAGWLLSCLLAVPYFYASPLFGAARATWVEERRRDSIESDVYFAARRKNC